MSDLIPHLKEVQFPISPENILLTHFAQPPKTHTIAKQHTSKQLPHFLNAEPATMFTSYNSIVQYYSISNDRNDRNTYTVYKTTLAASKKQLVI